MQSRIMVEFLGLEPVSINNNKVRQFIEQDFGFKPYIQMLSSERDQNFYVQDEIGGEYILKIIHPAEDRAITDFHTKALLHIKSKDSELPIPSLYPTLSGSYEGVLTDRGVEYITRLIFFLPGTPLAKVRPNKKLRFNLGVCLARVGEALKDFKHPSIYDYELLWDSKNALGLKGLLKYVEEDEKKTVLVKVLFDFEELVQPYLAELPWQVIHNDFNPSNVLIDTERFEQVTGLFDFGDMVYTPLVIDVAVGAAYNIDTDESDGLLESVATFIEGYNSVRRLLKEEVDLLYDLICVRLAMIILISNWRAALYPHNAEYLLRNHDLSWLRLQYLKSIGKEKTLTILRRACGL